MTQSDQQPQPVAKNLIVFCDGTNNKFGDKNKNTNVVHLLSAAVQDKGQQVVFYDPGVGTFPARGAITPAARAITALLGSAVGLGISRNVAVCYDFLMQNYAPGDKIFLFGFSRGAYTARVIAALIHACGLLRTNNPNLAGYALDILKSEAKVADQGMPICHHFKEVFSIEPEIHFLGLWDTVSSVGSLYNPLKLPFTHQNPDVANVRHAVSIDERRKFFRSNLWSEEASGASVKQIWFAGDHCDVGGGYKESESGLAKISLSWMMNEAEACGLLFNDDLKKIFDDQAAEPISNDSIRGFYRQHNELDKIWWRIAQFIPRRTWMPDHSGQAFIERWNASPREMPRFIPEGVTVHSSVLERMAASTSYRPVNLPNAIQDEKGHAYERKSPAERYEPKIQA